VFDLVKCVTSSHILGHLTNLYHSNRSRTLPFENRKNIAAIALSPDSNVLITVDEGQTHGTRAHASLKPLKISSRRPGFTCQLQEGHGVAPFQLSDPCSNDPVLSGWEVSNVRIAQLEQLQLTLPIPRYIAMTRETRVQVWRTPNYLLREFAPFDLHRTYTGHHDEVLSVEWSPDSKYVNFW
jgi:periodic tryptophan protein 2